MANEKLYGRISNPIWLILQGRYTPRQCGGLLCDVGRISRCRG